MNKKILSLLFISSLILAACNKPAPTAPAPTPTTVKKAKLSQVTFDKPALVSLTSRTDGRELNLTISSIPSEVKKIEYELLYKAKDGSKEIEKGTGDTINTITDPIERQILLGTKSCTSGCKYKYDDGVFEGSLKITYLTQDNGVNIYESGWTLQKSGKSFLVKLEK